MVFTSNVSSYLTALLICVLAGMYPYPKHTLEGVSLLQSLSKVASTPKASLAVALCTNVCVDLVVPAGDVMSPYLGAPGVSVGDVPFLATTTDVASAFLHHANGGVAGERSSAQEAMASLLSHANASPHSKALLGGNAALMAQRMAAMGVKVVLGGRIGPRARALLPPSVASAAPQADTDDVHLILEYGKGEEFGGVASPRANRFIVTSGVPGEAPAAVRETVEAVRSGNDVTGVLVLSGLHALENLPTGERTETLKGIADALAARTPATLPVHVELASTASHTYSLEVARAIFPHASSLGFNEGELASLYEALGGLYINKGGHPGNRGELAGGLPKVASVAYALRFILREFPTLTRLHFHALPYHILAHKVRANMAASHAPWSNNPSGAAAAGAMACALQACDILDTPPASLTLDANATLFTTLCPSKLGVVDGELGSGLTAVRRLSLENPTASWVWGFEEGRGVVEGEGEEGQFNIHFAAVPVPICSKPTRTVGLGDTVSASALATDIA